MCEIKPLDSIAAAQLSSRGMADFATVESSQFPRLNWKSSLFPGYLAARRRTNSRTRHPKRVMLMPRTIRYDASRGALLNPETEPTVFRRGLICTEEQLCVEISRLVYERFESNREARARVEKALELVGFTKTKFLSREGTDALITSNPDRNLTVASFRGTEQVMSDYITNLDGFLTDWPSGGRVHSGFARALNRVWPEAKQALAATPGRILFAGHSLGAALATLAASLRPAARLITFGSPRVGDAQFAALFTDKSVDRYINCCDVICTIPHEVLQFSHVGTNRYIDRFGLIAQQATRQAIADDQSIARTEYLFQIDWKIDTIPIRDLADHSLSNYVSALLELPA
jgi:hypothetical protein